MTSKSLLKHFIKLLFLWGFLHFHWNEQVSMHDLFCNELWWIFLSTLKWAASSVNPRTPPTHTHGDKPSDAQARRQDNGPEGQSYICTCINIFFCLSVITLNCLQHSQCLLKVRYCIEFKILLCRAGKEKKNQTLSELGPNIQG